ncbi:hypothetical protein BGZ76_000592 [Entomortierella beljakovae]|nr:hypothetical protein BGZ76_000592 [Entomortierella beljakovae]
MGWFSRSATAPTNEPPKQQDNSNVQPSVEKDESQKPDSNQEPKVNLDTASTPVPGSESPEHQNTQPNGYKYDLSQFPAEVLEFNEYNTTDDVFDRYKVSDAMNHLAACSSLGSNIRNYYRYGKYKNCEDRYDHLKFCLSIKTKSSQVAQVMIQKYEAEQRAKKRSLPSSEDVWTVRTHPPEELLELAREA